MGGISRSQLTVAVVNDKTGYSLTAASYVIQSSMQRGTFTIADTATSGTATVTAVTTAKAICQLNGFRPADPTFADPRKVFPTLVLTNTTTLTGTLSGTANGALTIAYELRENP